MKYKHHIGYSLLTLALTSLIAWNIYAWGINNYWEAFAKTNLYVKCYQRTPWAEDLKKMRHHPIGSCHELEVILNGKGEVALEEE
jgi:hypothetical protein